LARNGRTRDAGCAIKVAGSGWKETAMTEIDSTLDPFVEAEIKEHHAALTQHLVAIGIVICLLLILVGLHH
jgi:hypothetical protein